MEKKIVALKDLTPETTYPVVDLVKSNGERLGCATTAIINYSVLLGILKASEPGAIAEMALHYEMELAPNKKGEVEPRRFYEALNGLYAQPPIERYTLPTRDLPYDTVLALLVNNFTGLLCSNVPGGGGHADVIFYKAGKVYFNAFAVSAHELAELIYGDKGNLLVMARNIATFGRAFIWRQEMANLTFKLTEEEKYFLGESEVFLVENALMKISEKFWAMTLEEIQAEKEVALKKLGLLSENTEVI